MAAATAAVKQRAELINSTAMSHYLNSTVLPLTVATTPRQAVSNTTGVTMAPDPLQSFTDVLMALLFDETLQVCNWKEGVTCSLKTSEPTEHPTISPTLRPTEPPPTKSPIVMPTAAPNQYTFQKKTLPHGKDMIGYWHGNTQRASTMTPNQIDYSKLSRINYATFTTNENGKIYIRGKKNGSLNNDAEIITLLGPYVWHPPNDGSSKEYCTANPNNGNAGCMHHDYQQGMLHLAHLSGVQVYPSITLDTNQSLLKLDKEEFTKNAIQLLEDYEFDGLDIHFEMSLTGGQEDEAEALQSLLVLLRRAL
eukprot:CAMPEP_0201940484 /NCGR_PEP_ID=MMETSP0903-20130614/45352_1 /ASSEMBLY_ACC=CAM_ASM_000552 /TAXON_ID=420261 /ORGANISM="Thalassiosira antarctica, Strain CCMP982" /LENGTH=307 /DNA_ID=CAMNT_0048482311 /DNA_START=36 /DNA_END=955 /DNA_ORIENTATION=+